MRTLELYPFRFRDPTSGKWIRARHTMQLRQRHYADWEILVPPEVHHVTPAGTAQYNPFRGARL